MADETTCCTFTPTTNAKELTIYVDGKDVAKKTLAM